MAETHFALDPNMTKEDWESARKLGRLQQELPSGKKPRKPSGGKIEGWWVWFLAGDARTARRFETKEDALAWQPNTKGQTYLRSKVVMRVSFQSPQGRERYEPWSHDSPEFHPGPETEQEAYARIAKELTK
jgi:hypothetical protein